MYSKEAAVIIIGGFLLLRKILVIKLYLNPCNPPNLCKIFLCNSCLKIRVITTISYQQAAILSAPR